MNKDDEAKFGCLGFIITAIAVAIIIFAATLGSDVIVEGPIKSVEMVSETTDGKETFTISGELDYKGVLVTVPLSKMQYDLYQKDRVLHVKTTMNELDYYSETGKYHDSVNHKTAPTPVRQMFMYVLGGVFLLIGVILLAIGGVVLDFFPLMFLGMLD